MFEESLNLLMQPVNFSFGVIVICSAIMLWLSLDEGRK